MLIMAPSGPAGAAAPEAGTAPSAKAAPAAKAAPPAAIPCVGQICNPRQGMIKRPGAIIDRQISSPKSVNFTADGKSIYINSLEGCETLIYSFPDLQRLAEIRHEFTQQDASLFKNGETTVFGYPYYHRAKANTKNVFAGKPVEAAFSHNGRYLWVPYYRRSYDSNASCPSAMAIVDTATNSIVRVLPTGPLPKVVAVSPDNRLVAVTHWGDNTVGLIDVSGPTPDDFVYVCHLTVGHKMSTAGLSGDRDRNCGSCLRGTVFTPDSRHLLVGRMGGGGIACFSVPDGIYLGSFTGFCNTPRHLVIDKAGTTLYASNNKQGSVMRVSLAEALASVQEANGASVVGPAGESLRVGSGARTVALSPDERFLYVAVYGSSELAQVDLATWKVQRRVRVSPYPVGLAVSPDGQHVVVTSQGKEDLEGGNSVEVFRVLPDERAAAGKRP